MNKMAFIFLGLSVPELTWCFLVTGGNTSLQVFFCKNPGCASDVTQVFCNDELLLSQTPIRDCTGLPPANTVCQHDGRAFVSIDTPGSCDFEGNSYLKTEKCTDYTGVCDFTSATTSSPLTPKSTQEAQKNLTLYCVCGVIGFLALLVLVLHLYKKNRNREQNQQQARNTQSELSRLANGHSPSQHDPGD